jgi:hypothetical protein
MSRLSRFAYEFRSGALSLGFKNLEENPDFHITRLGPGSNSAST